MRAIEIVRREGLGEAVRRGVHRLVARERIVLLACRPGGRGGAHAPQALSFAWAGPESLGELNDPALDFTPETLESAGRRLSAGDACLLGRVDGRVATYLWVTWTVRELPGLVWPVAPGRAFFYKTFTRREQRGRGLNQAALALALNECERRHDTEAFIDINVLNAASLAAARKVGFREIDRFDIYRVGAWRRAVVGPRTAARVSTPAPDSRKGDESAY